MGSLKRKLARNQAKKMHKKKEERGKAKTWQSLRAFDNLSHKKNLSPDERFILLCTMNYKSQDNKATIHLFDQALKREHVFTNPMTLEERIAAIGYIVLREYNYSYTLLEVSKKLEIPSKRVSKLSRLFARNLGKSYVFSTSNVSSLVEKFCLQLNKDRKFMSDCVNLYTYLESIESRYPTSAYLAGIIYCVETTQAHKTTTQKDIAKVFNVTTWTIRDNIKRILSKLHIKNTFGLTIDDIIEGIRWQDQEV